MAERPSLEWGRRWWERQPQLGDAPAMDAPEWEGFAGSQSTRELLLEQTAQVLEQTAQLLEQTA